MIDLEEVLEAVDPTGEWEGDEDVLRHCGGPLEHDVPHCPECGAPNPLREAGLI